MQLLLTILTLTCVIFQVTRAAGSGQMVNLVKTVTSQGTTLMIPVSALGKSVSVQQQKAGATGRRKLVETFQNLDPNSITFFDVLCHF